MSNFKNKVTDHTLDDLITQQANAEIPNTHVLKQKILEQTLNLPQHTTSNNDKKSWLPTKFWSPYILASAATFCVVLVITSVFMIETSNNQLPISNFDWDSFYSLEDQIVYNDFRQGLMQTTDDDDSSLRQFINEYSVVN